MNDKILSVIIPVYNVAPFLHQCLNSVFSQDLEEVEVICVNDGSTDGSRLILQEFKDKYNNLTIIDRENGGLPAARNSGFKLASGKYIYFLDSDDYLFPGVLSKMVETVVENELDLACFNVLKDGNEPYFVNKRAIAEIMSGKDFYISNYEINGFFPPSAVWMHLFRREFLLKNNMKFKEGIEHEDEEFTPRAYFYAKRALCSDIPIQFHRVLRKGSVTEATLQNFKERNLKDIIETTSDLFVFLKSNSCTEKLFYHKLFLNYLYIANIIVQKKPERKKWLFSKNDFNKMKVCSLSWDWYIYYWLFKYSNIGYKWYSSNDSETLPKKFLNNIFKIGYNLTIKSNFVYNSEIHVSTKI
jgi:glycosyltransferase involved in cell wall biosynthesis